MEQERTGIRTATITENLTPEFVQKVIALQKRVCVSKDRPNEFGGFNYRSMEDILDKSKPAAADIGLLLFLTDDVVTRGNRFYVEATAVLTDGNATIRTTAYAREVEHKTKSDDAQVTGMASSYARKYCLSGLLQIGGMADDFDGENHDDQEDPGNETPETPPEQLTPQMEKKKALSEVLYGATDSGYSAEDIKVLIEIHFNKYSSKELSVEEALQLRANYVEWLKRDIPNKVAG